MARSGGTTRRGVLAYVGDESLIHPWMRSTVAAR